MRNQYDDIINLPHHVSDKHPHMSNYDRAAQFSPFAALSGYDSAITETARQTDKKIELSEDRIEAINAVLRSIGENIQSQPEVNVVYFEPDLKKEGGMYCEISGRVRKIDALEKKIVLAEGAEIPVPDILSIRCNSLHVSSDDFQL